MDEITITLPLPAKELSPNARVHWAKKGRAVRVQRTGADVRARMAMDFKEPPQWERAELQATFYLPDRRRRDADNLAASLKAQLDGIADAGVVANDAGFTHLPPRLLVDRENPRVELTIRPLP